MRSLWGFVSRHKPDGSQYFRIAMSQGPVHFSLPDAGRTKISVFDCLGREIMPVLDRTLSAGSHTAALNENNLNRGIYFVRMEHEGAISVAMFQITE